MSSPPDAPRRKRPANVCPLSQGESEGAGGAAQRGRHGKGNRWMKAAAGVTGHGSGMRGERERGRGGEPARGARPERARRCAILSGSFLTGKPASKRASQQNSGMEDVTYGKHGIWTRQRGEGGILEYHQLS